MGLWLKAAKEQVTHWNHDDQENAWLEAIKETVGFRALFAETVEVWWQRFCTSHSKVLVTKNIIPVRKSLFLAKWSDLQVAASASSHFERISVNSSAKYFGSLESGFLNSNKSPTLKRMLNTDLPVSKRAASENYRLEDWIFDSSDTRNEPENHLKNQFDIHEEDVTENSEIVIDFDELDKEMMEEIFLQLPAIRYTIKIGDDKVLDITSEFFGMVRQSVRSYKSITFNLPYTVCSLSKIFIISSELPAEYEETFTLKDWQVIKQEVCLLDIRKHRKKAKAILSLADEAGSYNATEDAIAQIAQIGTDYHYGFFLAVNLLFNRVKPALNNKLLQEEATYTHLIIDPYHTPVEVISDRGKHFEVAWDISSTLSKTRKTLLFPNKGSKRPDAVYYANGVEIGAAEFKPLGYTAQERNQDFIKLAHHLKNQVDQLIDTFDIPEDDAIEVVGWQATGEEIVFYKLIWCEGMDLMEEIGQAKFWTGAGEMESRWEPLALFQEFG
ncbi:hypothetical protein HK096_004078, partial [Nowakowskiella sp. JEL0078]